MLWLSSLRTMPRPLVVLPWGSISTISPLKPSSGRLAATLMAVVVFPTPPFWLTTAETLGTLLAGTQDGFCPDYTVAYRKRTFVIARVPVDSAGKSNQTVYFAISDRKPTAISY